MTKTATHDWRRLDAMTDGDTQVSAQADPDALPLTDSDLSAMRRVPRVGTLRRALGLSQEAFAARYHIPIGTLRDWEQAVTEPDPPAAAYLRAIAGDPEGVERALRVAGPAKT